LSDITARRWKVDAVEIPPRAPKEVGEAKKGKRAKVVERPKRVGRPRRPKRMNGPRTTQMQTTAISFFTQESKGDHPTEDQH
jgi:hypothetical protein